MASEIRLNRQDPRLTIEHNDQISIAQRVICSLEQVHQNTNTITTDKGSLSLRQVLQLSGSSSVSSASKKRRKRRRRRKKKPPILPNTRAPASKIERSMAAWKPSIFQNAVKQKLIPHEFNVLNMDQEVLLQKIMKKWSLSDALTLTDLLGVEIFDLLTQTCDQIKHKKAHFAQDFSKLIIETFAAEYFLIWESLLAQDNTKAFPEHMKYIDDRFLLTKQTAYNRFKREMNEKIKVFDKKYSEIKSKAYKKNIEAVKERIDLFLSLYGCDYYLELLTTNSIRNLCDAGAIQIKSANTGFDHLKVLMQFQMNMLVSAHQKSLIYINISCFVNFVRQFPKTLNKDSIYMVKQSCQLTIGPLNKLMLDLETKFSLTKKRELYHLKFCQQHNFRNNRKKKKDNSTADLFAKYMATFLACSFAQDVSIILDEELMPIVFPEHRNSLVCFNRMILNSRIISSHYTPRISKSEDFIALSKLENIQYGVSIRDELQSDFKNLAEPLLTELSCYEMLFYCNYSITKINKGYLPIHWASTFEKMKPIVTDKFTGTLETIKCLHQKYLVRIECLLNITDSHDEALQLAKELNELFLRESIPFCQIIMFCTDLRALMDLYDLESLETEDFLLPRELTDFLELKGIKQLITKVGEPDVNLSPPPIHPPAHSLPLLPPARSPSPTYSVQSADEGKESDDEKESLPKFMPKADKTHAIEERFRIRRGEKALHILKRIKQELGLTPERINGSHHIFPGGAVLPIHGGRDTLPIGTAKSLEKQLNSITVDA